MKLNIKEGLRRIVKIFIGLCALICLCFYIGQGLTFDNSYVIKNSVIYNTKTNSEFQFVEQFNTKYFPIGSYADNYWSGDFECYPYKRYCVVKDRNMILKEKMTILNDDCIFKMPNAFGYFLIQVWDLLKIIGGCAIAWYLYLLIELIFIWVINGFKEED